MYCEPQTRKHCNSLCSIRTRSGEVGFNGTCHLETENKRKQQWTGFSPRLPGSPRLTTTEPQPRPRKKDARDALLGLEIVLVTPTGLVLADFAQSAKKYQYFVSGFNPVASTLTVKSTS